MKKDTKGTPRKKKVELRRGLRFITGRVAPWLVTWVENGKKRRKFFETQTAATKELGKITAQKKRLGQASQVFTSEHAREYAEAKKISGDTSLVECAAFWRDNAKVGKFAPPLKEAAEMFVALKRRIGRTDRHCGDLERRIRAFVAHFDGRPLTHITASQIIDWLSSLNRHPRTVLNYWGAVNSFLRWAKRKGWLVAAPEILKDDDLPAIPKEKKPVYSLEETRGIMDWVQENRPNFVPWFALQIFAGLRNSEASQMRFEWLDRTRKRIVIPAEICKTNDDWVLQCPALPDTVWDWLGDFPESGKVPRPLDDASARINAKLVKAGIIKKRKKNAKRHTFCTMHISLEESAEKTAVLLRHTSPRTLYKGYLAALVPQEDARAFFALRPKGTKKQVAR